MKNIWILLFLSILFKRTNAMEGDNTKIDNEFYSFFKHTDAMEGDKNTTKNDAVNDAPKSYHKEVDNFKIIQHDTIEISPDEAKELKKKLREILKAPKERSKDEKLRFDFLKLLPNSLNKCKKNYEITAFRPNHLFYLLEHRRANERERILQKFMKSFEFGGVICDEELACNNLIAFPDSKSIAFYRECFYIKDDFRTKEVYFQLHWKHESFPVLIEFEQKKFIFRTMNGAHFYYCDLIEAEYIQIDVEFNFKSSGKCPFKVEKADLIKPKTDAPQNIEVLAAQNMIQSGVWYDVEEIKEAFQKMRKNEN